MLNTGRVYDRILDPEQTGTLSEVIAESGYDGMQTFDRSLIALVRDGLVAEADARAVATNPHDFALALEAEPAADLVSQGAAPDE